MCASMKIPVIHFHDIYFTDKFIYPSISDSIKATEIEVTFIDIGRACSDCICTCYSTLKSSLFLPLLLEMIGSVCERVFTKSLPGWKVYSALNSFFIVLISFTNNIGLYKLIKNWKTCFSLVFLLLLVYLFIYLLFKSHPKFLLHPLFSVPFPTSHPLIYSSMNISQLYCIKLQWD